MRRSNASAQRYADYKRRSQEKIDAGLVSDRLPGVSGMTIRMTYYQESANPVLMVRTINVLPSSHAYFRMRCLVRECVGGGFDLSPVIDGMVRRRKRSSTGKMTCAGCAKDGGASISYEIDIRYAHSGTLRTVSG